MRARPQGFAWGGGRGRGVCLAALLAAVSCAWSQPAQLKARLDVSGTRDGIRIIVVGVPKGGSGRIANWHGDEEKDKQYGTFEMPAAKDEWREMSLSFIPGRSGKVELQLKGMWYQVEGMTQRLWIVFDDVTVTGAKVVNGGFEETDGDGRPAAWWLGEKDGFRAVHIKDPARARTGQGAVEVAHDQAAGQSIQVEANTMVTVKAWQRLSKDQ